MIEQSISLEQDEEGVDEIANEVMEELSSVQQSLTKLEDFSVAIIDSYLSGCAWEDAFEDFFKFNCPRFKDFDENGDLRGVGFDFGLTQIHQQFLTTAETLLAGHLSNMNITSDRFLDIIDLKLHKSRTTQIEEKSHEEKGAESALMSVLETLRMYEDFLSFGKMMRKKYEVLYMAGLPEKREDIKRVRVLWDIENFCVPAGDDPFLFVQRLYTFLTNHDWAGPGVDTRITAFHCPFKKTLSKIAVKQLDRAAVEQVMVSEKREDADRKLGIRINQEMQVLIPENTTFIILTSDTDYRHHFQLLTNSGFKVVVLHQSHHSQCVATLSLHATEVYALGDLPELASSNANNQSLRTSNSQDNQARREAEEDGENATPEIKEKIAEQSTDPKSKISKKSHRRKNNFKNQQRHFEEGMQYEGTCSYWDKKGWGKITSPTLPEFFVHNTALPANARFRYLQKGEEVRFIASSNPRGPIASSVEGSHGQLLLCQQHNNN